MTVTNWLLMELRDDDSLCGEIELVIVLFCFDWVMRIYALRIGYLTGCDLGQRL